jgi:anhydro-N-acetylmuramic acid kinase
MSKRWFIGLASRSSGEGVEAALVETKGSGLNLQARLLHNLCQPMTAELRQLLNRLGSTDPVEMRQVSLLHRVMGETLAGAARHVADRASFSLQNVSCIGCPGHTVWHDSEARFPSSLELGMATVVAERTGITTVSEFRSRDLASGGQGGPLAALADFLLFRDPQENRILIHLGGVASIVYLPANGKVHDILGFDAGPCNVLLNDLTRQMTGGREALDPGGKHAVQGRCVDWLLEQWCATPYLKRRPPKSLSRQGLGDDLLAQAIQLARDSRCQLHDLLCTATHFVACCITLSLKRFIPPQGGSTRIFLSGGGTRNGFLWHLLEQQLAPLSLAKIDQVGIPMEARKPLESGMLAALTVDGVPGNLPSATGAAGGRLLGSITPGSPANWARCLAWMLSQTPPSPRAINEG